MPVRIIQIDEKPFHAVSYQTSGRKGVIRDAELPFYHATATGIPGDQPLLFTADLQGRVDGCLLGVHLADEIRMLVEFEMMKPPTGIALAGDLYDHPDLAKLGASGEVDEVFDALAPIAPLVGVLGNHDRLANSSERPEVIDGSILEWNGLNVGGVGGIIGDSKRDMRRGAEGFEKILKPVLAKRPDILLLHQGPSGDESQRGSPGIDAMLPTGRSMLVVCGHCHWPTPLAQRGQLQVMNVDARVIVVSGK